MSCSFVGQYRGPAHASTRNRTLELSERFRIHGVSLMIFLQKDPYLFCSSDTFGKRATEGRQPGKKCKSIDSDHRPTSRHFLRSPPWYRECDYRRSDDANDNWQRRPWWPTRFAQPKPKTAKNHGKGNGRANYKSDWFHAC